MLFTSEPAIAREYVEPDRRELSVLFQFDDFDIDTEPEGNLTSQVYHLKIAAIAVVQLWSMADGVSEIT